MRGLFSKLVLLGALAGASGLAGCDSKVSLPDDARVSCASNADCPGGWTCHQAFCQLVSTLDTTPPDLASADVREEPTQKATKMLGIAKRASRGGASARVSSDRQRSELVALQSLVPTEQQRAEASQCREHSQNSDGSLQHDPRNLN
jgi:hypothetical protein